MGSAQSAEVGWDENADSPDGVKKVVQTQEPEMLPCHSSASPLSPQLSSLGTPRLGPSIKVWDPYNVLSPPPPPPVGEQGIHVYLISHGESVMNLRPDLIAGRCPEAALTPNGKRQARALAVFLRSQGVRFNAVYSSPLDRARSTALLLCQELEYSEEQIQCSDAVVEMSQGHWEGCYRSEIYSAETLSLMERFQPDFSPPSGESLRQVEFRMVEFLNGTILDKFRSDKSPAEPSGDRDGAPLLQRHRQGLPRKKSGKSRLQVVTTTGDQEADDEMMNQQEVVRNFNMTAAAAAAAATTCVGVFTHSVPIKCAVTGILGCSAVMSQKLCIEESSVTVLQHSWKTGWQIKRLNDTAHLRLL